MAASSEKPFITDEEAGPEAQEEATGDRVPEQKLESHSM